MSHAAISKQKIALVIGAFVILIAAIAFYLFAGETTDTKISAGDKVIVTVVADSVEDMYGYQFRMNYDPDRFEYSNSLESNIDDIGTIFSKPFDGYELIGATMVGDAAGVDGSDVCVCELTFTALQDCTISDEYLSISDIEIVTSDLASETNAAQWNYKAAIA